MILGKKFAQCFLMALPILAGLFTVNVTCQFSSSLGSWNGWKKCYHEISCLIEDLKQNGRSLNRTEPKLLLLLTDSLPKSVNSSEFFEKELPIPVTLFQNYFFSIDQSCFYFVLLPSSLYLYFTFNYSCLPFLHNYFFSFFIGFPSFAFFSIMLTLSSSSQSCFHSYLP